MSDVLDLVITLTPPPAGSPPDAIARIGPGCPRLGSSHEGDLLRDPLAPDERAELRWYLETYWRWPFGEFAERGARAEVLLVDAGRRLYAAVFNSIPAHSILQAWRLLRPKSPHQISVVGHAPTALTLPWELLHDSQGFLALRSIPIVRRLPQAEQPPESAAFTPPLRVLLVTARPDGAGFIDQRAIARELLDEVQAQVAEGRLEVELLRPPTLEALQRRLRDVRRPVHILHFDGHGAFDGDPAQHGQLLSDPRAQGKLAFEDDDGRLELVAADRLANVLQGGGVRLAVLTACQSAVGAADDAFSSVAGRLIQGGVDAVVAMGASVLVVAAARYVEAFYRELAQGTPAPAAHERARQALYARPLRHVYQRDPDRPGRRSACRTGGCRTSTSSARWSSSPAAGQAQAGRSAGVRRLPGGLSGRAPARLLRAGARAAAGRAMAAARQAGADPRLRRRRQDRPGARGRRLADPHGDVPRRVLRPFEHGGDAPALLHALGAHLGLDGAQFDHTNIPAALDRLRPALQARPTLLIADNLESILPGGDAPLPPDERARLWDVLIALAAPVTLSPGHLVTPCGVLLTTRTPRLGDGRLAPGPAAAHLALRGLLPDDAYDLAGTLLDDLQIDRARAPYRDLRDLLEQLDQHPLAIHLVLPALRDHFVEEIRDDFAALLPRFADDHATGRNRSLLASLDYSLRRLSDEQRALLVRLAPFEGGASEDDLLAIAEIPAAEWGALRPALEQAALLTAERVANWTAPFLRFHPVLEQAALLTAERVANWTAPFLRFHPVLAPYLRTRPDADDPALAERYARRYQGLARYLYKEDNRNPQPVRALVWRELPNLRRAIRLLAAQGDGEAVAEMVISVARFLGYFGLLRERAELQLQCVAWNRRYTACNVINARRGGPRTRPP